MTTITRNEAKNKFKQLLCDLLQRGENEGLYGGEFADFLNSLHNNYKPSGPPGNRWKKAGERTITPYDSEEDEEKEEYTGLVLNSLQRALDALDDSMAIVLPEVPGTALTIAGSVVAPGNQLGFAHSSMLMTVEEELTLTRDAIRNRYQNLEEQRRVWGAITHLSGYVGKMKVINEVLDDIYVIMQKDPELENKIMANFALADEMKDLIPFLHSRTDISAGLQRKRISSRNLFIISIVHIITLGAFSTALYYGGFESYATFIYNNAPTMATAANDQAAVQGATGQDQSVEEDSFFATIIRMGVAGFASKEYKSIVTQIYMSTFYMKILRDFFNSKTLNAELANNPNAHEVVFQILIQNALMTFDNVVSQLMFAIYTMDQANRKKLDAGLTIVDTAVSIVSFLGWFNTFAMIGKFSKSAQKILMSFIDKTNKKDIPYLQNKIATINKERKNQNLPEIVLAEKQNGNRLSRLKGSRFLGPRLEEMREDETIHSLMNIIFCAAINILIDDLSKNPVSMEILHNINALTPFVPLKATLVL